MTIETCKAIECIIGLDEEVEAIKILNHSLALKYKGVCDNAKELSASLRAIRKINAGKNKAIDALCEETEETDDEL